VVVYIILDDYVLEGVPARPYIVLEDKVTDTLARYELGSGTRVLLGLVSFCSD
jgi:hypothetical protein